ncbi:MAG: DUF3261 domain-containing protein [Rhodocyclaceae bacterium]|nr:MAG: DUF3261 domain-containing protein [Rhodocyclaceae bacterium]
MKRLLCYIVMVVFSGCATLRSPNCVSLHAGVGFCLQSAHAVGDFSVLQRVDVTWNQRKETALVELETESSSFTMAVLTPMGQKLMQFKYVPSKIIPMGGMPIQIDPALIAALVQLSIWPDDSVLTGLYGQYEWKTTQNRRVLSAGGQTVLDIAYEGVLPDPDRIQVRLPLQNLDMHIQSLGDTVKP